MRGATSKEEKGPYLRRFLARSTDSPMPGPTERLARQSSDQLRSARSGARALCRQAESGRGLRLTRNNHEVVVSCKGNRRLGDGALHRSMISGQMRRWRRLYRRIGHT